MIKVHRPIGLLVCLLCVGVFVCSWSQAAAVPADAIRAAQQRMETDAPAEALDALRELLVDYPESPEIRFSMGCAWLLLGDQHARSGNIPDAQEAYGEARAIYDTLAGHEHAIIAREAIFNRANVLLREADIIEQADDYQQTVSAWRRAVDAYEYGLAKYPDHADMQTNHAHARWRLKQLLQNPPPEEEQEQQEEEQQETPDTPPPTLVSRFDDVSTWLPGAQAFGEDNIAVLQLPDREEAPEP